MNKLFSQIENPRRKFSVFWDLALNFNYFAIVWAVKPSQSLVETHNLFRTSNNIVISVTNCYARFLNVCSERKNTEQCVYRSLVL